MSQTSFQELDQISGKLRMYGRVITAGKRGLSEDDYLPRLGVSIHKQQADIAKAGDYAKICGFEVDSSALPMSFPHVMSFGLQMELMLLPEFPLPLLGIVHLGNRVRSYRKILPQESLDITVELVGDRLVEKGREMDLEAKVYASGQLVWEGLSTYLSRCKVKHVKAKAKKALVFAEFENKLEWKLADDLGRQYAAASGDSNPIHLYPWTAKLLGFKRHIAHGMWSKARIIAELLPKLGTDAAEVSVEFKLPIFLPGKVVLHSNQVTAKGCNFELRNDKNDKIHVVGSIKPLVVVAQAH